MCVKCVNVRGFCIAQLTQTMYDLELNKNIYDISCLWYVRLWTCAYSSEVFVNALSKCIANYVCAFEMQMRRNMHREWSLIILYSYGSSEICKNNITNVCYAGICILQRIIAYYFEGYTNKNRNKSQMKQNVRP